MPDETQQVFAAEWVLPVSAPPLRDGAVAAEGGRIAWVGPRVALPTRFLPARVRAFPRSLLLPGFVNAHAHLSLTGLLGQLQGDAEQFVEWIRDLLAATAAWPADLARYGIAAGLDMLALSGTTTVAQVQTLPDPAPFFEHPLRVVLLHEVIAFPPERAAEALDEARRWLDRTRERLRQAPRVTAGLAPHGPYSCSPELIGALAAHCRAEAAPFSLHLAETEAERAFLRAGGGPFEALLRERGAWSEAWRPPGVSPVRLLADLGALETPGLAVHCNYLEDEDMALLARGRLTPVWCPGSHAFFAHPPHPAPRLIDAGVPLALGTDSLASNVTLDMGRELRLAAAACPAIAPETWLRAATLEGARALGLGEAVGSLGAGKHADLLVLEGVRRDETDPLRALVRDELRVRAVFVGGEQVRVRRAAAYLDGRAAFSQAGDGSRQ